MGTSGRENTEVEPKIGAAQLDEFFRELRQTVLDLENAFDNGNLSRRLGEIDIQPRLGSAISRSYRRLAKTQSNRLQDPNGRRMRTVHDLLSQMREELFEINTWFHAEIDTPPQPEVVQPIRADQRSPPDGPTDRSDSKPPWRNTNHRYLVRQNVTHPIRMRPDQILGSRSWGIGFVFDDQDVTDALVAQMTLNALRKFAQDLDDLTSLLPRVLRAAPDRFPHLVPPRSGRAFEQLITDILNEEAQHAQLSGLCEDYLQKTDIRVKYPDLDRKRGARVQVTIASTHTLHQKKILGMRHPEQFVILSPWSLASAVPQVGDLNHDQKRALLGDDLIREFWECIPGTPSDIAGLSNQLKTILTSAITQPLYDPRGPLVHVPDPIRRLIQIWVHAEALRSTQALRIYEATEGRYRRGRDGRLRIRRLSDSSLSPSSLEFIKQHPTDSTVRATVERFSSRAAWVEFSSDLHGRVDRKEISWSDPNADPQRFLDIGREYEFKVRRVSASRLPAIVELSLKRTMQDPWRPENLRNLATIGVVQGRIVRKSDLGLFVEIESDLIGLLHVSRLPEDEPYSLDQMIAVTIESIDIKARRMVLAPA